MKTRRQRGARPAQTLDIWQASDEQPPLGQDPALEIVKQQEGAATTPEIEALLAELIAFGVQYHPETPCHCGCPLSYTLRIDPTCLVCCRCLPGGHMYGHDLQARLEALFPRVGRWMH